MRRDDTAEPGEGGGNEGGGNGSGTPGQQPPAGRPGEPGESDFCGALTNRPQC